MSAAPRLLRSLAYHSGALSLARARQPNTLTVLMLHRVLDQADPDFANADPIWTLSLSLFDQFLGFLRKHYDVVDLADVIDAQKGIRPLPSRAALITFDDGWADNLRYAAPTLQRHGLPAVVFAVGQAIAEPSCAWWQEIVFAASRQERIDNWLVRPEVKHALAGLGAKPRGIDIVSRLGVMEAAARDALVATLPAQPCHARMMLEPGELRQLADYRIDIGLHGYSHMPLTAVPDIAGELRRARDAMEELSAGTANTTALGFPHGQYDGKVVAEAFAQGITHMFSSDPCLNQTQRGMLNGKQTLGRINVVARHIEAAPGELDPAGAARWLWARECR
jgi:peptidoglycan/xylan/chitin deacetylase (PgdA/CDA1 family)